MNFGVRVFDCCRCWLAARTRLNRICEDSEQVDGQSAPTQNSVSTSVSSNSNVTLYLNCPYFQLYTSTICAQIWPLQFQCVYLFTGNIQLPLALNINMHHVHQTDHYKVKCVAAIFNLFVYTVNLEFPRILFAESIFQFWLLQLQAALGGSECLPCQLWFSRTLGFYGLHRPIHQN